MEKGNPRLQNIEYLCHSIWMELKLDEFLSMNGISEDEIFQIESIITERIVFPDNENNQRKQKENGNTNNEKVDFPSGSLHDLSISAGERLLSVKDALEKNLVQVEKNIFNLTDETLFFDLRNIYPHGLSSPIYQQEAGTSGARQNVAQTNTLGLVLDIFGFVRYSRILNGDQLDNDILRDMVKELDKCSTSSSCANRMIIINSNVANEENVEWFENNDYHYIAVNHSNSPVEEDGTDMHPVREDEFRRIIFEFKRLIVEKEVLILYRIEDKNEKDKPIRLRIGELSDMLSKYILKTDRVLYSDEEIWGLYKMVMRLKSSYTSVNIPSEFDVYPSEIKQVFDVDILISILAYHIITIIEYRLRQYGEYRWWHTIRDILKGDNYFEVFNRLNISEAP
ncbi:MAG: hypothetical protein SVR08_14295 [Spirochaetota bacterium]|nr:hypothetical protein [Spirochaetota bacterium]